MLALQDRQEVDAGVEEGAAFAGGLEAALELRELADDPVGLAPRLEGGTSDPESFGTAARALLGVTLTQQGAWRDARRALNAWLDAVSGLDVLVLKAQSIPVEEMNEPTSWAKPPT